jgi:carboxyl-terminal processing protease
MSYIEEAGTGPTDSSGAAQRPVYYTMSLHRKVYGGGGIAPDFTLRPDTLNVFERRLSKDNVLFDFANHYATAHRPELDDVGKFINSFDLSKRDLADIRKVIEDKGIAVKEEDFQGSLDFIRRVVMQEVALSRWGREAQFQVNASLNPEVNQALNLFDRAEQLVADRNSGTTPGAASRRGRSGEEVGGMR